jgi:transcriptional regulator GlxA family with amidase domain
MGARYVRQPWVEDGKLITGAGASAAIDVSLFLVARLRGEKSAKQVQIAMGDPAIRHYIRTADRATQFTTSVCTGALLLASVGMLQGRDATTHWGYAKYLEQYGARYLRRRWVVSGKIINSAGVSAGIDMALYLISRLTDEETARQVQLAIHYNPAPPFGEIDYERLPILFKAIRSVMSMSAPFYTRKPKQMIRQGI